MWHCVLFTITFLGAFCTGQTPAVRIVDYVNQLDENSYYFQYSLNDGQTRKEAGAVTQLQDTPIIKVSGEYSFKENGNVYLVSYVADGYRPEIFIIISEDSTETTENHSELDSDVKIKSAVINSLTGGGVSISRKSNKYSGSSK